MAEDARDKALALMRMKGPVLPSDVAKTIKTDQMLASAVLSDLKSSGAIKISSLKVGGSPLYFLPGQESQLENYRRCLNEKDQRTFDMLKQQKVMKDRNQTTLVRVSLRQIKDFAVPLTVTSELGEELFWKWHTISDEEAGAKIKIFMDAMVPKTHPTPQSIQQPIKQQPVQKPIQQQTPKQKPVSVQQPQKEHKEQKPKPITTPTIQPVKEEQKTLKPSSISAQDNFTTKVLDFFSKNNIEAVSQEIIKKNKEADFIININAPVGKLQYYCKARDKKSVNEADLSIAYVISQTKKLPALFLTSGKLTKKAEEMLARDFKGMTVKKF